MERLQYFWILSFNVILLYAKILNAQQSWCQNHFDGFSLEDDYNRNSPPTEPFNLNIDHILLALDAVSYIFRKPSIQTYSFIYYNLIFEGK